MVEALEETHGRLREVHAGALPPFDRKAEVH
jgi:hypothetical protein